MASNLELIGINERSGLITPNLYKQDWTTPTSVVNNYSVVHTRAISDIATPIYGKGTGIFLDTANGGGEYDIKGNINYLGSGRVNAISINTAQWSYGPTTPYSVINTRALSDTITPIYGKGTGIFLDTTNGGGEYDINGNQIPFPGSGRVPLMNLNYSNWTFGPANIYRTLHPHALAGTDVHGKGTNDGMGIDGTYAAHMNYAGGSSEDINGNTLMPGSGRVPSNTSNTNNTTPTITIVGGVVLIAGSNKPFGYGYNTGEGYDSSYPVCSNAGNTINVGSKKWP